MTGPALRQFRESQGLSQAEFALLLGIGLRSLQRYEAGSSPIPGYVENQIRIRNKKAAIQAQQHAESWNGCSRDTGRLNGRRRR